jgi:hypothetical protein
MPMFVLLNRDDFQMRVTGRPLQVSSHHAAVSHLMPCDPSWMFRVRHTNSLRLYRGVDYIA